VDDPVGVLEGRELPGRFALHERWAGFDVPFVLFFEAAFVVELEVAGEVRVAFCVDVDAFAVDGEGLGGVVLHDRLARVEDGLVVLAVVDRVLGVDEGVAHDLVDAGDDAGAGGAAYEAHAAFRVPRMASTRSATSSAWAYSRARVWMRSRV